MLRCCLILSLWLLAFSAWAIPVNLADTGSVAVYAHPNTTDPEIGQLPGGSRVDVVATDMTKGYLLIQYQQGQAWIKASSVVDTTNVTKTDDSVQQVLNHAFSNAGTEVGVALSTAQSKLSHGFTPPSMGVWTNKQARSLLLTGALILLLGLIFGLLLGKMMWRPRRSFLR